MTKSVVDVYDAITNNPIGYAVGGLGVILMMINMGVSTLSAGVVEEKSAAWWRFS